MCVYDQLQSILLSINKIISYRKRQQIPSSEASKLQQIFEAN